MNSALKLMIYVLKKDDFGAARTQLRPRARTSWIRTNTYANPYAMKSVHLHCLFLLLLSWHVSTAWVVLLLLS